MNSLLACLHQCEHPKIIVLGDLMLDRYTWGNASRVSPEAPVLVLAADREEVRLGGAASVAGLLRGLEAEVVMAGVLGDGASGRIVRRLLEEARIDGRHVILDESRSTTTKERLIGRAANRHAHQILRVDRESTAPIGPAIERQLMLAIESELSTSNALLISDYAKGVCTPRFLEAVIEAARQAQVPVLIDPARGADYHQYRGANLIKPNRAGAAACWGKAISTPEAALAAGTYLCQTYSLDAAVITLDQDGMALTIPGELGWNISTRARSVYDITGAGDMALAMLGLCQASGIDLRSAVELANVAAGLQVERLGVESITRAEIAAALEFSSRSADYPVALDQCTSDKLVRPCDLPGILAGLRQGQQTIVFTNGCFDLLHVGHVAYLQQAALLGDVLIVGLNSDSSVRRCKGAGRPVIAEVERASLLAALACVDYVVIFDEDTPEPMLRTIRPEVLVKGGTYSVEQVVGREFVESYGGKVCVSGKVEGVSTTNIVRQLQESGRKNSG